MVVMDEWREWTALAFPFQPIPRRWSSSLKIMAVWCDVSYSVAVMGHSGETQLNAVYVRGNGQKQRARNETTSQTKLQN